MKKLIYMLAAALTIVACTENNSKIDVLPESSVKTSIDTLGFTWTGKIIKGENPVRVSSSHQWLLSGRQLWCKPSVLKGNDGGEVTFEVENNTSKQVRSQLYTFICNNQVSKLFVYQNYEITVDVDGPSEILLNPLKSDFSVAIISEKDIQPVVEGDWITLVDSRKSWGGYTYDFTAKENETRETNNGKIIFTYEDVSTPVAVSQEPKPYIELAKTEYKILPKGQKTVEVEVMTNADLNVKGETYWFKCLTNQTRIEGNKKVLVFEVEENSNLEPRMTKVKLSEKYGVASGEFDVMQSRSTDDYISTKKNAYSLGKNGGEFTVTLSTNALYDIEIDPACDWVHQLSESPTTIDPAKMIEVNETFSVDPTNSERNTTLKFISRKDKKTVNVMVTQTCEESAPQTALIPDDNFRQHLLGLGYVTIVDEATKLCKVTQKGKDATRLTVSKMNIHSVSGVELFENLTGFDCSYNYIKSLNLSWNKKLGTYSTKYERNPIEFLDLGSNESLKTRVVFEEDDLADADGNCSHTKLTIKGTVLKKVSLGWLDTSAVTLTDIDLTGCPALEKLEYGNNYGGDYNTRVLRITLFKQSGVTIENYGGPEAEVSYAN